MTSYPPLALRLTHRSATRPAYLTDLLLILGGSLLVALLSQVRIPLPFTPVPISGQTLGVLLAASVLGARRGSASLALYVAEGSLGLPVFAGASSGIVHLLGPTGGYLVGFIAAAYLVGWLAECGWDRHWSSVAAMFALGTLVIYLFGALYLARFVGLPQALAGGVLPFLLGDALKAACAAALLPLTRKI